MDSKLKELIDEFCTGQEPTEEQMTEIMSTALEVNADMAEADAYMQQCRAQSAARSEQKFEVMLDDTGQSILSMTKTLMEITGRGLAEINALIREVKVHPVAIVVTGDEAAASKLVETIAAKGGQAHVENLVDADGFERLPNGCWKDRSGVIYSHDRKTLLEFPPGITDYKIHDGTVRVGEKACYMQLAKSLRTLVCPPSLRVIEDCAFGGCNNLQRVTLNEGLEVIGEDAFRYCESLESLVLPETVVSIGKNAFDSTGPLCETMVIVPDSVTSWGKDAVSAGTLLVPAAMAQTIKKARGILSSTKVQIK